MGDPSKNWHGCRRNFLKLMGGATAGAVLILAARAITGAAWAEENGIPANGKPDALPKPDLVIKHAIQPGKTYPIVASTPYVEIHSIMLHRTVHDGRLLLRYRFTSRDIKGAQFHLTLLGKDGQVVASVVHREDVGPEKLTSPSYGVPMVRYWDKVRGSWISVPIDSVAETESFSLEIQSY